MPRLTIPQLEQIRSELTDKDRQLLSYLQGLRFAKTDQLRRIFYPQQGNTLRAVKVAVRKNLNRLQSIGLIDHLNKQIGGVRAGSQAMIWFVTESGNRLLNLGTDEQNKRKRRLEPPRIFLRHTVAISETFTQIIEICRNDSEIELKEIELEPDCWRSFEKNGRTLSLRPDLFVTTVSGEYMDHTFIEVDLDTESPTEVVEKCRRYHDYYRTGKEKVFPLVLWIVPTDARKKKLIAAIKDAYPNSLSHLFYVIVPNELERIIKNGVPGGQLI